MFPALSPLRSAVVYYCLAIGLVTAVAVGGGSTAVAMMTPLVAALLMLLVVTREGWTRRGWASLGLHRLGLRAWPVAILVPLVIVITGGAAMVAAGAASWNPEGQLGDFAPWLWPGLFLINVAFASVTVSLTEEIGWRGYLVPRLVPLGMRRAMLLSGLMHGLWHVPVILLTDLYLSDGNPAIVIPMFLLAVTAVGVFLGWLRFRTDSVWPAVLAHSAHNVGIAWVAVAVTGDAERMEYLGGESGIVPVAAYVLLAGILLTRAGGISQRPWVGPAHSVAPTAHRAVPSS